MARQKGGIWHIKRSIWMIRQVSWHIMKDFWQYHATRDIGLDGISDRFVVHTGGVWLVYEECTAY